MTAQPAPNNQSLPPRFPVWLAVVAGLAVLVCGGLVIARIAAPLAGLLAPADPPFFSPARLLERRMPETGVDEWLYATEASGCEVYDWYAARADVCRLNPGVSCAPDETDPAETGSFSVGYCQGSKPFGDFAADWEIYISDGYNDENGRTRFLIAREIDWINAD